MHCVYPCPCGYYGDDRKECTCGLGNVQRYQSRISGPPMDRVDIHADVVRVPFEKLVSLDGGETSAAIRARVEAARKVQAARFTRLGKPYVLVNGDMGPAEVQQFCEIDEVGKNLMRMAVRQMDLSERILSPGVEIGPHDCGPGRGGSNRRAASGRGLAVPTPGVGMKGEIGKTVVSK